MLLVLAAAPGASPSRTSPANGLLSITRTGPSVFPVPELADYTELPINDAARLRGDS